jgi:hypothetical protein
MCGCTRGYKAGQLVNGLIYIVKDYNDEKVSLTLHPDYNKDHQRKIEYLQAKLEELQPKMLEIVQFLTQKKRTFEELKEYASMDDEDAREFLKLGFWTCKKGKGNAAKEFVEADEHHKTWAENATGPATLPDRIVDPVTELPWLDFQIQARLTHCLPYVYFQGKTIVNKTLWLMGVSNRHFDMRYLIMALGRVQESRRVRIVHPDHEAAHLVPAAREAFRQYERRTADDVAATASAKEVVENAERAILASVEEGDFSDVESEGGVGADPFADLDWDDKDE